MAFIHPQISPISQIKKKNLLNLCNLWIMFFHIENCSKKLNKVDVKIV